MQEAEVEVNNETGIQVPDPDKKLLEDITRSLSPDAADALIQMMREDPRITSQLGQLQTDAELIETAVRRGQEEAVKQEHEPENIPGVDPKYALLAKGAFENAKKKSVHERGDAAHKGNDINPSLATMLKGINLSDVSAGPSSPSEELAARLQMNIVSQRPRGFSVADMQQFERDHK